MTLSSGSAVDPVYAAGGTVTLPAAPTRTNYNFAGWYTEANGGGTEFTALTAVSSSIRVYADWAYSGTLTFTAQPAAVFTSGAPAAACHAPVASLQLMPSRRCTV